MALHYPGAHDEVDPGGADDVVEGARQVGGVHGQTDVGVDEPRAALRQSITAAPSGRFTDGPISAIRPSRATICVGPAISSETPSKAAPHTRTDAVTPYRLAIR